MAYLKLHKNKKPCYIDTGSVIDIVPHAGGSSILLGVEIEVDVDETPCEVMAAEVCYFNFPEDEDDSEDE